jgi:predicted PurR-regulated permease PerM
MSGSIFSVLFAIFGGVFSTLFVVTAAIFISLEEKSVEKALVLIFPQKYESYVLVLWARCQKKVAGWFGARLIGCLFVGVVSAIVFLLFNVKYPFTLGFFAAVFNFIPYVGPFLTGLLLFLLVFPVGMMKAIFVLVAFVLIQQVENHILSPLLMKRFVDLPPVLVLVSMVVGAKIWGFLGAILIIPIAGILFEFLREFLQKRKEKNKITVVGE